MMFEEDLYDTEFIFEKNRIYGRSYFLDNCWKDSLLFFSYL